MIKAGEDLRIVQGQELIKTFEAPIIDAPPPYTNRFCGRCGSPVPVPSDDASTDSVVRAAHNLYAQLRLSP